MFEKSKYEKLKASNGELNELCVYAPISAPKQEVKNLQKAMKDYFTVCLTEKGDCLTFRALCEEFTLEEKLGEIMELAVLLKTDGDIKITVNEAEYII